jgi:tRNA (guanine26-N2/guanine27-N2)-dimethyltransferase
MFGLVAQSAMRLEAGIEPIFCHHDMHYFRAYCRIMVGNSYSKRNQSDMGFVAHCFACGYRSLARYEELFHHASKRRGVKIEKEMEYSLQDLDCPNCKASCVRSRLSVGGPLWIGKIASTEFVSRCAKFSKLPLFHVDELDVPLYYDLTAISKRVASRTPKLSDVMNALNELGYATSRTRLNPNALRTAAPVRTLRSVVLEFAR